mgnify:CR=1 FL=1
MCRACIMVRLFFACPIAALGKTQHPLAVALASLEILHASLNARPNNAAKALRRHCW